MQRKAIAVGVCGLLALMLASLLAGSEPERPAARASTPLEASRPEAPRALAAAPASAADAASVVTTAPAAAPPDAARGSAPAQPARAGAVAPSGSPSKRWSPGLDALGDPRLPPARRRLQARFEYLRTDLNADGTPLLEVLEQLRRESGVAIELTPAAHAVAAGVQVLLRLKGIALRAALHLSLASDDEARLCYEETERGVRVLLREEAQVTGGLVLRDVPSAQDVANARQQPRWERELKHVLDSRRVTVHFPETPLSEVLNFLEDITGLNIVVSGAVDAQRLTVTLRRRDVLLREVLEAALAPHELGYMLQSRAVLIRRRSDVRAARERRARDLRDLQAAEARGRPTRRAEVAAFEGTLAAAAAHVAAAIDGRVDLDPATRASGAHVSLPACRVEEALERLAFAGGTDARLFHAPTLDPPQYVVRLRGSRDAFYDAVDGHLAALRRRGGPAVEPLVTSAQAAHRQLLGLRRVAAASPTLVALREALPAVIRQERVVAARAVRAALAADAAIADQPLEPDRLRGLAEVVAWSRLMPGCSCPVALEGRKHGEGCLARVTGLALELARRLPQSPLPLDQHPGRALLAE